MDHYRILRRHMVFVSKELEAFLIKMASKHRSFHTVIHIFIERVSFREIVYWVIVMDNMHTIYKVQG